LVSGLNGEAPSAVLAREPQAATEALYRSMHLEPLVEELARRFAATGAASDEKAPRQSAAEAPASPTKYALEDMLLEFDRRTSWLAGGKPGDVEGEEGVSGPPLLRPEILAEVRARLAARLNGVREALARGRKQGAQARPARNKRPPSLTGTPCDKENNGPMSPGSPSKKSLSALESAYAEVDSELQEFVSFADAEVGDLRAAFAATLEEVVHTRRVTSETDRQAIADEQTLQEQFHGRVRGLTEARLRRSSAEATNCSTAVAELETELLAIGEGLPDSLGQVAAEIAEARDTLEAQRLQRQEAGNEAQRSVEARLKAFREEISVEANSLVHLRDGASQRFREGMEELQATLVEETAQRKQAQLAMTEVVHRLQLSLEVSAEIIDPTPARLLPTRTPPRTPVNATPPPAPMSFPGHEALGHSTRPSRPALWGGISGSTTPVNSSRSSTPRRTALPAPPVMSGREW